MKKHLGSLFQKKFDVHFEFMVIFFFFPSTRKEKEKNIDEKENK